MGDLELFSSIAMDLMNEGLVRAMMHDPETYPNPDVFEPEEDHADQSVLALAGQTSEKRRRGTGRVSACRLGS